MKKSLCVVAIVLLAVTLAAAALPASPDSLATQNTATVVFLNDHLKPFLPFIGKTWRGTGAVSDTGQAMSDVSHWERALNGQAIRVLHSVNNGEYGGQTMIVWDEAKNSLVFFYFTTAGFYTTGTMKIEGTQHTSHEYVTGNENGITEVKAVSTILPDGRLHTRSQYLQNGTWVDGHEFYYREDSTAAVIFK